MGKKVFICILISATLLLLFAANAFYRWDQRVLAPIAYRAGIQTAWYQEQTVTLQELRSESLDDLKRKLHRQGFVFRSEATSDGVLYSGFHREDGQLRWYKFELENDTVIYRKDFSTAAGLCSQVAGVAINQSKSSIRLLNPGGSCV